MTRLVAAVLVLAAAASLAAQSPVVNAVVERHTPSADFGRDVQAIASGTTPAWIGYRVPIQRRGDTAPEAGDWCCGRCRLAPPTDLVVLARVRDGSVADLRAIAIDCDMDAGGMPLFWFDGVTADASVGWLSTLVTKPTDGRPRVAETALSAIAQHAGSGAAKMLVQIAQSGTSSMRGRSLVWLARRAADQALPTIDTALQRDPDTSVKKQAVVALSRFPNGEGIPKLMDVARSHSNAEVRRQAMLTLGQSNDPRAVDFFAQILLK